MFWFFIPVLVIVAIIAICVAIYASKSRRDGGSGVREPGETVYDRDQQRKTPDAPPA